MNKSAQIGGALLSLLVLPACNRKKEDVILSSEVLRRPELQSVVVQAGRHQPTEIANIGYQDIGNNVFSIPYVESRKVSLALSNLRADRPDLTFSASDILRAGQYAYGDSDAGFIVLAHSKAAEK